jgi:ABC-type multidrug transport system fused ATPase/permease subunit
MGKNHNQIKIMKKLYFEAWIHSKPYFLCTILLIIVNAVLPFASIYIPKIIIDAIVNKEQLTAILLWVFIMTAANYLGFMIKQFLLYKMSCIEDNFADICRTKLGRTSMDMEYRHVENSKVLDELEKATRGMFWYSGGLKRVTNSMVEIISNVITLIGIFIMVITMRQLYVIVICIIVLAQIFIEYKNSGYDLGFFKEMNKYNREFRYYTNILQNYDFGKEIRLYGAQPLILSHVRDYEVYSDLVFRRKAKQKSITGLATAVVNMILQVSAYANICRQIIDGAITIGSFSLLSNAYVSIVSKSSAIFYNVFNIKKSISLISDFYSFIDTYGNSEKKELLSEEIHADENYTIEFRHVSFCYPNSDVYVLKDINTKILSNQKVSIVGKNGAGKTTFIKLLVGLYQPVEGQILLNGKDIKEIPFKKYQKIMATVFQDFKTYTASIKDNICMDSPMRKEDYEEVIDKVRLKDVIDHLPDKDETILGKQFSTKGQELSGGQKQRIAIAKAMYKDSPFLILDEPTAALDVKMEYEIYQLVSECKTRGAVIFISHRLSSCTFCDRILVFDQGKIVQDGNHQQLYREEEKLYHKLFYSQAKYYV